jgi:hypothetical protein
LLNICDNYLRWSVFPVIYGGELVIDRAEIRKLYFSGNGYLDVVASIPFDFIILFSSWRSPKLVRALLRLPKMLKCFRMSDYQTSVDRAAKLLRINDNVYYFLQITCCW